jgi:hypothetical protein
MKLLMIAVSAIALGFAPSAAFAMACTEVVTTTTSEDQHVTSNDDPAVPNCVMYPSKPYAGGRCENVMNWTNSGTSVTTGITRSCPVVS